MEAADRRVRRSVWRAQQGRPSSLFALAEFLRESRQDLQREWEDEIRARRALQRAGFADAVARVLERVAALAESTANGAPSDRDDATRAEGIDAEPAEIAIGYALLRRTVVRRCLEQIPELGPEELMIVEEVIDDAASTAMRNARVRDVDAIIDNSPSLVFVKDTEGKFLFVNRKYARVFGLDRAALTDMTDADLHPPETARRIRETDRKVMETGTAHTFEELIPTPLGERVFVVVKFPLFDRNGAARSLCGIATDITPRKRAEEALQESEARYRLATAAITDAIWDWNLETDTVEWSAGVKKLFGYPAAEIPRAVSWWYENIHPDDRERVSAGLHAVIDGTATTWKDEYRFRHRDGGYILVCDFGALERDAHGTAIRMVGAMQDVSALRAAQHQLERSEEQFRTLADSIPQLAWMADASGSISWYNQRWYDYTGSTLEEMRGWGWQKAHHPDHVARVVERIRRAFDAGEPWEDTFPLRSRNGEYRRFLSRAFPIRDEQGRVVRWFGTNTDIEERLRVEEELQRRIAFEEQLIGIVSHDLRNPIGAIQLGCELLTHRGTLDERDRKTVKRVSSSAERALRLVRDLLDFTRARMGKELPLERRPIDLHEVAHAVIEEMRLAQPQRAIDETHEGDGNGEWDPDRLAQVFTNLLGNAVSYSAADSVVHVALRGEPAEMRIEVQNAGDPIPPEVIARLFEPFERGTESAGGSRSVGLGLFIVDRIVRAHHGTVEVRSTADEGTIFRIRLPRAA